MHRSKYIWDSTADLLGLMIFIVPSWTRRSSAKVLPCLMGLTIELGDEFT